MESQIKSPEAIREYQSEIILNFFRHGEKEKDKTKTDEQIRLTPGGRMQAKNKAEKGSDIDQSVAFVSTKERTWETAGFVMAGGEDEITGNETLEELKTKIDKDLAYGSKFNVDSRLDFSIGKTEYEKQAIDAFTKGKFMEFLADQSDTLAKEQGFEGQLTYSRQAKGVAEIVLKYFNIAPRWNKLVEEKSDKYEPEMKRFFATHQGIAESFLMKVVEMTKGIEERNKLIKALKNTGFDVTEGFELDVITKAGSEKPTLHLKYSKKSDTPLNDFSIDEEIDLSVVEQIAQG
ncbi:MAG: histidine phosphatase family protein [Candidatus Paceibacterota bacterium]|jgi:hypothetical protein